MSRSCHVFYVSFPFGFGFYVMFCSKLLSISSLFLELHLLNSVSEKEEERSNIFPRIISLMVLQ